MTRDERLTEILRKQQELEKQLQEIKEEERKEKELEQGRQDSIVMKHIDFFLEFFDTHLKKNGCRNSDTDFTSDAPCPRCKALYAKKYGILDFKANITMSYY